MKTILRNRSLWISIALFIFYYLFSSFSDFSFSKSFYQNRLNDFILKVEKVFDGFDEHEHNFKASFDNNFGYLIFSEDSLLEWSSNKLPSLKSSLRKNEKLFLSREPSGVFLEKSIRQGSRTTILFYKLKNIYPFENEYLKNTFSEKTGLPQGISLSSKETPYPVFNSDGNVLAYLLFTAGPPRSGKAMFLAALIFAAFICFFIFLYTLLEKSSLNKYKKTAFLYLPMLAAFLLFNKTQIFSYLKSSDLFQPESFAFSSFFSSLLSMISFLLVLFLVLFFENQKLNGLKKNKKLSSPVLRVYLSALADGMMFAFSLYLLKIITFNTSADIDLSNLVNLSITGYGGLFAILLLIINYILFNNITAKVISASATKKPETALLPFLLSVLMVLLLYGFDSRALFNAVFLLLIYGLLYWRIKSGKDAVAAYFISMAVILSVLFNINLVDFNKKKEEDKRRILIQTIAINQDPEVEFLFSKIQHSIYKDSTLISLIRDHWLDNDTVANYILNKYFSSNKHWLRYDFQITLCDKQTQLLIKPSNVEIACSDYFYNNLISAGHITSDNNLYRLEYGSGQINYLGLFRFRFGKEAVYSVYVEINSKIKRKGFTKLLSPSGFDPFEKVRDYSLAKYEDGKLLENYGDYSYRYARQDTLKPGALVYYNEGGFSHLMYKLNYHELFVLSKPLKKFLNKTAPFAYLFVLVMILSVLFILLTGRSLSIWSPPQSFSFRLQIGFVALLALSLIIIAVISTVYIKKLNSKKDERALKRTAFSLKTEFEHKLAGYRSSQEDMAEFLSNVSNKFSKIFNTDINIYNLDGDLIASTKPELFKYHLLARKISPLAIKELRKDKFTYVNFKESIGTLVYYSAYMPFHDASGNIVAYINFPYFAQQHQLRQDLSTFVMTLTNVYTFMIVISVLAILLLSNYIIRPLKMIKEKMRKIRVGKQNEYIVWKRKDEIGQLVEQYNRMVDELAESAEILAKSERESAWQQMARQVAHEIKNPLTPMKLSVQYLLRSIEAGEEDIEDRIKKLSKTLIEQIDTLAAIATAFSDFAKMPANKKEIFDLKEAVEAAIKIFQDYDNVQINFITSGRRFPVFADKQNLIRVFNNLIKNAIQSFSITQEGFIDIEIEREDNQWKITVRDNGSGIPAQEKDKIFVPNFTTKSGGMGLGLAMVRNIIISNGGSISFESQENKGTVFYIYLPVKEDEQDS